MQRETTGYLFFLVGNWKQLGRGLEGRVFGLAERTELGPMGVKRMWRYSLHIRSYTPVRVRGNITKDFQLTLKISEAIK